MELSPGSSAAPAPPLPPPPPPPAPSPLTSPQAPPPTTLLGPDDDPRPKTLTSLQEMTRAYFAQQPTTRSLQDRPLPSSQTPSTNLREWFTAKATGRSRKQGEPRACRFPTVRDITTENTFSVLMEQDLGAKHPINDLPAARPGPSRPVFREPSVVPQNLSPSFTFGTTQPSAACEGIQTPPKGKQTEVTEAMEVAATPSVATISKTRIPPVCVFDKANYLAHVKYLKSKLTGPLSVTNSSEFMKFFTSNINDYNLVKEYFSTQRVQMYTHQVPTDRQLKVVIRNLPETLTCEDIQEDLANQGFAINNIHQFTKRDASGAIQRLPLYSFTLGNTVQNRQIYSVRYVCSVRVKIEAYRGRSGPTQCHKCQRFGHTSNFCSMILRCVKCGENHLAKDCPLQPHQEAKCVNCTLNHPASWKGCSLFIKIQEQQQNTAAAQRQRAHQQRQATSFNALSSNFGPALKTPRARPTATAPPQTTTAPPQTNTYESSLGSSSGLREILEVARQFDFSKIMHIARLALPRLQQARDGFDKMEIILSAVMAYFA